MNFAPYAPPPDERRKTNPSSDSTRSDSAPTWQSKPNTNNPWSSYQQGGSVVDPSGLTSGSSAREPKAYNAQEAVHHRSESYSRSLGHDARPGSDPRPTEISRNYLNAEAYETRLGWRVDLLAALAYCTPLMGFIILAFETKNDYIRIHAYQSLLTAIPLGILHFLFLWSHFLQVLLLIFDLALYGWLGYHAHCSAEMLERNLLPIVGPIAEQWTSEE
ncbi:hypothetical protein PTTG_02369 [Puccinia triticina 1-1 BBBD Race 1]|uniref:Uncharacterized protein n=2 Tax=Puccinia triticina TaxID=208348 RepID=A0A0C4ENM2_PUCT1|nr:uncharacterized protein PtA15_4A226 [Puccinia triticina]OAV99102.1 hypothetical protein PTTG_02369 [Puccinia triticina 1-1 BBBD Race 1]WAQ83777.1 hypothetical protein PtA15_4A226 [Puccinia triticina]WAR54619.1 hypothetical protein PtB15_4B236 [Puccinia triticina]